MTCCSIPSSSLGDFESIPFPHAQSGSLPLPVFMRQTLTILEGHSMQLKIQCCQRLSCPRVTFLSDTSLSIEALRQYTSLLRPSLPSVSAHIPHSRHDAILGYFLSNCTHLVQAPFLLTYLPELGFYEYILCFNKIHILSKPNGLPT